MLWHVYEETYMINHFPFCREQVKLYSNVSGIRWQYDCPEEEIKGCILYQIGPRTATFSFRDCQCLLHFGSLPCAGMAMANINKWKGGLFLLKYLYSLMSEMFETANGFSKYMYILV